MAKRQVSWGMRKSVTLVLNTVVDELSSVSAKIVMNSTSEECYARLSGVRSAGASARVAVARPMESAQLMKVSLAAWSGVAY